MVVLTEGSSTSLETCRVRQNSSVSTKIMLCMPVAVALCSKEEMMDLVPNMGTKLSGQLLTGV
jgi:hypothetical protein